MNVDDKKNVAAIELYQRFQTLLAGDSLSEEEKKTLSQEILKIIYERSSEEVGE